MWNRKELKKTGNERFRANYWKCVLAALVLALCVTSFGSRITKSFDSDNNIVSHQIEQTTQLGDEDLGNVEINVSNHSAEELIEAVADHIEARKAYLAPMAALFALIAAAAVSAGTCLKLFLLNPLEVSGQRFFITNLHENAQPSELGYCFSNNYLNIVKVMFFRSLYRFLWTLLLVVPGIVKAYEYRMIPYLLAENPEMTREDAFAQSKAMMTGNKWNAFVLDLSFIGWHILNAITMGILGLFFVNPYEYQTDAALYEALKLPAIDTSEYENYVEVE